METGTDYLSIADRLKAWRSGWVNGVINNDDLLELQTHLKDAYDEYRGKGLGDDEAWLLAERRLGDRRTLAQEYAKVKPLWVVAVNWTIYMLLAIIVVLEVEDRLARSWGFFNYWGGFPGYNLFLVVLFCGGLIIAWRRRKLMVRVPIIQAFGLSLFVLVASVFLCFLGQFESPPVSNRNVVFSRFTPDSKQYRNELLRVFNRLGTDNLYFKSKFYRKKEGQDYLVVKVIGKGFSADFPVNITGAAKLANFIRLKGKSYEEIGIEGLKFDVVTNKSGGPEFIFRDLKRFID